ncbi:MAG: hypothetical protein R2824_01025 [Saprospiraceae bacterium]|nr:hypothetical protein [Lewinella sp.]
MKHLIHEDEETMDEKLVFDWDEKDEASMQKICPRLFARYWNNPLASKY